MRTDTAIPETEGRRETTDQRTCESDTWLPGDGRALLQLCEPVLVLLARGATASDAAAPGGLTDHMQCAALSSQFRGRLCQQLAERPAREISAGAFLYLVGGPARSVFLIRKGLVKTSTVSEAGNELTLRLHRVGDIFGELCLCAGGRREQARAVEASSVIEIPVEMLLARLRQDPLAALEFASAVCDHLADAYARLHSVTFDPVARRVARALLALADELNHTPDSNAPVIRYITQEELGHLVGVRREVVSGLLNRFKERGLISYVRRGAITLNRQGLHALLTPIDGA